MKNYLAIAGKYETVYEVHGPFQDEQLIAETWRFCADNDYRPDEDRLLNICVNENGVMAVIEIEPYRLSESN